MTRSYFFIHPTLVEISWPTEISENILREQLSWKSKLEVLMGGNIEGIRLGFNKLSFSLHHRIPLSKWEAIFKELEQTPASPNVPALKCWQIPVCYDPDFGNDLYFVAEANRISISEVIQLHLESTYLLHFYGFLPGFMYLGGLNPILHTRRKATPDRLVKAGSVAIGGMQTGIYPRDSPGGWQIIGRSPLLFFNIKNKIPVIPQIGDRLKFFPITPGEYLEIEKKQDIFEWQQV